MTDPRLAPPQRKTTPTAIDVHVGARIRLRRMMLGLSMVRIADEIGITWQQLKKYESARDRISASRLYSIAAALGVTADYFFDHLQDNDMHDGVYEDLSIWFPEDLRQIDGHERYIITTLIGSYWRIADAKQRRRILDVMDSMVDKRV